MQTLCLTPENAKCPVHGLCAYFAWRWTGQFCGTDDTVDAFSTGARTTRQRNLPTNTVKFGFCSNHLATHADFSGHYSYPPAILGAAGLRVVAAD
jgi:hypothetical protein